MAYRPFRIVSNRDRGRGIRGVIPWVGVVIALVTTATIAQVGPVAADEPEETSPSLALDLPALLTDNRVVSGSVGDAMFVISAPSGKRFFMVPVNPLPVEKDTKLDAFTVKLAAGRFIAWYLPEVEGKSIEHRKGVEFKGPNDVVVTLNFIPPRLTKECVLTADGRIKWSIPRALLHSKLHNDSNAYTLKADPTRLKAPSQPRITRNAGESPLAYQKRRRELLAKYQADRTKYVVRRKAINETEDDFEEPIPDRLWAVYEATPLLREFKLSGPSPLPWKIDIERFRELREMATKPPAKLSPLAKVVTELVADRHPLSDRAAAIAITSGDTPTVIPTDHALVDTIKKLLSVGDRGTRMQIAAGFAKHAAAAPAAGPILLAAATDPDPSVTFGALSARVAVAGSEPDAALTAKVTESVSRLLSLSEAPAVGDLINLVLKLAAKQPANATTLADGVDLSRVHDDHRAAMIFQVLGHAARNNTVAMRWLDRQLLGGSNARIRNETMAKIVDLAAAPAAAANNGKAPTSRPTYRLTSVDHAIVKIIALDDVDVRAMAWAAIQSFRITGEHAPTEANKSATKPADPAVYAAVTDIALKQNPTPTTALAFMHAQADRTSAEAQITRMLIAGQGPIRLGALRSLAALGKDSFVSRFAAMSADQRIELASHWYATDPRSEPAVTASAIDPLLGLLGLSGEDDQPADIVKWFAGRIVVRDRPTPREWAAAMSSEQAMLNVLSGSDEDARRAAAAGLAARIGWPTDELINGIIKLAEDVDRTETDPAVRGPKLAGDWASAKATLAADTLQASAGTYSVRLVIDAGLPADAGLLEPTPAPQVIELGRIAIAASPAPDAPGKFTVAVDPEAIKIAASTDAVALAVADALSLNALAGEDAQADTTLAAGPITLAPAANGGWSGAAKLANKRGVRVEFVRVN